VTVIMRQGYFWHGKGLIGDGQVAVSGGLAGAVIDLLGNGQLLFVVLDGLQFESNTF
jgi:hypothetical protein